MQIQTQIQTCKGTAERERVVPVQAEHRKGGRAPLIELVCAVVLGFGVEELMTKLQRSDPYRLVLSVLRWVGSALAKTIP